MPGHLDGPMPGVIWPVPGPPAGPVPGRRAGPSCRCRAGAAPFCRAGAGPSCRCRAGAGPFCRAGAGPSCRVGAGPAHEAVQLAERHPVEESHHGLDRLGERHRRELGAPWGEGDGCVLANELIEVARSSARPEGEHGALAVVHAEPGEKHHQLKLLAATSTPTSRKSTTRTAKPTGRLGLRLGPPAESDATG